MQRNKLRIDYPFTVHHNAGRFSCPAAAVELFTWGAVEQCNAVVLQAIGTKGGKLPGDFALPLDAPTLRAVAAELVAYADALPSGVVPPLHMEGKHPTRREVVRWCIAMLDAGLLYHFDDDAEDITFSVPTTPGDRALLNKLVEQAAGGDFDHHACAIAAMRYRQRFPKGVQ